MKRKFVSDLFGFPAADGYFNGTKDSVIEVRSDQPIQNGSDFTLSFHLRPRIMKESTLVWLGYGKTYSLSVKMESQGNVSIK